jgi:hypothetical protein
MTKTAGRILAEAAQIPLDTSFDVFLSHSYKDATAIADDVLLGIKAIIERYRYTVYVDWVIDPHLSRNNVTSRAAEILRERMKHSRSLLFVTSTNSSDSKWMPWELGYVDGAKGTAAILPLAAQQNGGDAFEGQEYLGIYPYVAAGSLTGTLEEKMWVHEDPKTYVLFDSWLQGHKPRTHP